jgi:protein-L-isoaspartate O-methyltransferase
VRSQRDLTDALRVRGVIPPAWESAVASVDRGLFVPDRFPGFDKNADPDGWREKVYSDTPVITQFNDGVRIDGVDEGAFLRPTSSSSMPSIMLEMLALLDVREGHRVLEVGTGTGYQAAWLCHRLGDERVTSIEYDPVVLDQARAGLAAASFRPHLVLGDGLAGHPPNAPYDRVLVTCTVRTWGALTAQCPNGRVVAPWGSSFFAASFATLDVRDGVGCGRFSGDPGFMWDRTHRAGAGHIRDFYHQEKGEAGSTRLPPQNVLQDDPAFFVGLHVTDAWPRWCAADDDSDEATLWIFADDGASWATVEYAPGTAEFETEQYGPRRLWDEVEAAYGRWQALGSPPRDRFGLTVTPTGRQHVWLDTPATVVA